MRVAWDIDGRTPVGHRLRLGYSAMRCHKCRKGLNRGDDCYYISRLDGADYYCPNCVPENVILVEPRDYWELAVVLNRAKEDIRELTRR